MKETTPPRLAPPWSSGWAPGRTGPPLALTSGTGRAKRQRCGFGRAMKRDSRTMKSWPPCDACARYETRGRRHKDATTTFFSLVRLAVPTASQYNQTKPRSSLVNHRLTRIMADHFRGNRCGMGQRKPWGRDQDQDQARLRGSCFAGRIEFPFSETGQ